MSESPPAPPLSLLSGAALFLDFDGTLVELAEAPDAIRIPGELQPLLQRLARLLGGRIGIVSGRAIADLDAHLGGTGIAVSGSHGLELRFADGSHVPLAPPPGLERARTAVRDFAGADSGLLVEEKPAGIALHYRQAPEREAEAEAFMAGLADETGLALQSGKMVAELRAPGADKGDAIRAFMKEPAFAGARPVFVGDDLTDEHGFAAAAAMGGAGILVGAPRPTAAAWRLGSVADVARWLDDAAEALGG